MKNFAYTYHIELVKTLFTAIYNDLPRHNNDSQPLCWQAKFQEIRPTQHDADKHRSRCWTRWNRDFNSTTTYCFSRPWLWLNAWPSEMCERGHRWKFAAASARPKVMQSTALVSSRVSCNHAACLVVQVAELGSANKATDGCIGCSGRRQTTNRPRVQCRRWLCDKRFTFQADGSTWKQISNTTKLNLNSNKKNEFWICKLHLTSLVWTYG